MPDSHVETDILDLFRREKKSYTISQIAQLTGHDRRTVAHHLALLHQSRNLGMIQHGVRKKYFVPDNALLISRSLCAHIILVINQDYSIRWINDPFLEVLGCTRDDVPHITLAHLEEIFPAIHFKSILAHLTHGETRFIKESCEYKEAQFTYIFSFSAIYIQNEPHSFIITGQDISENERIKNEYQKKEQSFEILIKNIPGIVFRRDILSNTIELFSDKVYLINKSIPLEAHTTCISFFDSYIHPDDRDRLIGVLQYALLNQEEYETEFRVINSHGYEFHFLERGRPSTDPATNTQYIDAIIMDITSLKKTTELLVESEERFRKLADVAPVGIYITDKSGDLQFVNHEWCRQHNLTQNHAIGMPWTQGIHPDDRKLFLADDSESTRAYKRIIYRTNPGNGGYTWIHGISVPIEDREGTITGYIGCDTDISEWRQMHREDEPFTSNDALFENQTDLKRVMYELQFHKIQLELINNELARTRDELEESLAHYVDLYENAPIGYVSLNQNGFIKKINQAGATILGRDRVAILDTPLYSYISDFSSQDFWEFFSHLGAGENDHSCVLHLHRPFHEPVIVHVTASRNAVGQDVHLILIDITEKEVAEKRLRESEKALSRSQEIAHVGSWYLDLYSGQMTWSDEAYRLFGLDPGEAVGYDTVFRLIHPEDRPEVQAAFSAIQEGADIHQLDHRIIRQDTGEIRHVHEWCVHERSQDDTIIRTFGVIQDITELKRAETRKALHTARLQTLLELSSLSGEPIDTIMDFARKAGLAITNSRYSFIGRVHDDESVLTIHSWSDQVMADCRMQNTQISFPIDSTGLWGMIVKTRTPVLCNDYEADRGGDIFPAGHVPITRFLGIPVIKDDRVVAICAVANKIEEYQDDDVQALTILGNETFDLISQKLDKEALIRSEERYRLIIENQRDFIIKIGVDGVFLFVNQAFCDFVNRKEDDLLGSPFTVIMNPADIPDIEEKAQALFAAPYQCSYELRIQTPFGWRWISWNVRTLRDDNGEINSFIASGRDITAQKEAEDKVKEQEAFQQLLIQLATKVINVPIDRLNPVLQDMMATIGTFTHVDRVYIFHNDNDRMISRNTHEWCAPGIKPEIENLQEVPFESFHDIMTALQQGKPAYIPDVSKIDFSEPAREILESQGIKSLILLPFMHDGMCTGFVGFDAVKETRRYSDTEISLLKVFAEIIANVLSREETETALRENEKVLAITQDIAQIGSWCHDARSGHLAWSDMTCQIFQVNPQKIALSFDTYLDMVHPDDRDLVERVYAESRENGLDRHELEYRIIPQESHDVRYIYDLGIHERDSDGEIIRSLGMIQDITSRKRVETALEESNRKLRILTRRTRYDIRTMLQEIRQYLDLASDEPDTKASSRYLHMARDMSAIIEKTIDFTRDYEFSGVSYAGWLNLFQTISASIHGLPRHQVQIENMVPPVLEIYADPMMRNVFTILLEHAVKVGRGVTRVRFSVKDSGDTRILICEDNGTGIPAEDKELIFIHGHPKYTDTRLFLAREILSTTGLGIRECAATNKGAWFEISIPKGRYRM